MMSNHDHHSTVNSTMSEEAMSDVEPVAPLSGAFAGHFVAGTIYSGFGLFLLLLVLKRALESPGHDYAERHIPERNPRVLFRIGMILSIGCPLGVLGEALSGWIVKDDWFLQAGHEVLYFTFFFSGVVFLLESLGRLPSDSCRMGIAVTLFAAYLQWGGHAHMKPNEVDERLHVLLANTSLASSIATAWSVREGSKSFVAYIVSFALVLLQGLWLYTAAFNLGAGNRYSDEGGAFLTMHNVTIIFCVELLFVAFAIVFATAYVQRVHEWETIDDRKSVHDRVIKAHAVGGPEYEGLPVHDVEK